MVDPSRRALPGRLAVLFGALLLAAALGLPGCSTFQAMFREMGAGGDDPQWQTARWKGVGIGDVLHLAETASQREYPHGRLDTYRGELETGWVYGLFDEHSRAPLRQRIVVHVETEGPNLLVKLRAQQEKNDSAGRNAGPQDEGWEPYSDDVVHAATVMQRVCILLKDIGERVPDPKPEGDKS